jgi:hypothetical protein
MWPGRDDVTGAIKPYSFEDMMAIMRYNDFQHDPLSSQLPDCQSVADPALVCVA